jgi:hypothetical protein
MGQNLLIKLYLLKLQRQLKNDLAPLLEISRISFLLSYYIFSWVHNGLGFGLSTLGILWILLHHHVNLRTIKEPTEKRYASWISDSNLKFTISIAFGIFIFLTITILFSFLFTWNLYVLHLGNILILSFGFILIPKYYINQNKNLKLYVSVYHWVPAPVLPWQLPKCFDPKSVNLVCVKYPSNE